VRLVIGAYLLPLAAMITLSGRLGDVYGRRRLFVLGTVVFALASGLCALAPDADALIAARVVQGMGAALERSAVWGLTAAPTLGLLVAGFALLVAFVVFERRTDDPLVDLRLVTAARSPARWARCWPSSSSCSA
jgi:MFS family permease